MIRRNTPTFPRLPLVPTLIQAQLQSNPAPAVTDLESAQGLSTRADFDAFAVRDDVPGALGVREMKFVITQVDTDHPTLHLMNSNKHGLHYRFVTDGLGIDISIPDFNRVTYFTENRRFIVGSVLAFDSYTRPNGEPGLYALEFWPTDPIGVAHVKLAYSMLLEAMPFAAQTLAYHPSGDMQQRLFARNEDAYASQRIRAVATAEIFESISYNPLNLGEAVGELRLITDTDSRPPSPSDIVIYDRLPNDLPLVAGVITSAPQTPLSHVNLRAQQNAIPNAYLRNAGVLAPLDDFIGKIVWIAVTPDEIQIREATAQEQRASQNARRPRRATPLVRNLRPKQIVPLDQLLFTQSNAYGGKATGVAELRRAINPQYVPNGFAVPFAHYDAFMTANGFYDQARTMLDDPDFQADASQRKDMLKDFRKLIKKASVPKHIHDELNAIHSTFPAGRPLRCRSSANAEDAIGFTGAGLYDSYTHREDEGHLQKSVKQVWASLWNFRAFEERAFYRIDHFDAAMGVLIHPNFDDERVNGVAITRNLYFETFDGYYVNAQVGEALITNPTGDETAEELLIMKDLNGTTDRPYEMIYVRRSSLVGENELVIAENDLLLLAEQMRLIQNHFSQLYGRADDASFAMDIEFKFDKNGLLAIKQARPWIS